MRFIVYGAGAIGGVVGARLAQAGADVVLIARGAHAAAIAESGLTLAAPDGSRTFPLPVVTDPAELVFGPGDVVLLGVKSQDTPGCLDALRAAAPPSTPVACVQNGVANEPAALRFFENVYGVCVLCPATHLEPGVVEAPSAPVTGLLDIGRYPGGTDELARSVSAVFERATFHSQVLPDVMRWKYNKLLRNLGNALDALCGPAGRSSPLLGVLREEGVAVLSAAGIPFASEEDELARRADLLTVRSVNGQRRGGSSTWQSLRRRTGSVETDYLNGEIALLGRLHNIPTPANALLQTLMRHHAAARTAPGTLTPESLLAALAPGSVS
jgi:2-dehydropantoate 2-reductase